MYKLKKTTTYDVNKLNHCETKVDPDGFVEVLHGADEGIVSLILKQVLD